MLVSIGVSNRHVHLKKEDLEILFGKDYELTVLRPVKQPGQFACNETVTIKTDKSEMNGVRVLGPIRDYTQVEISKTDSYKLGLNPPIRTSGDLKDSSPITIIGPKGKIDLEEGCIMSNRHIHISRAEYEELGFKGLSEVSVKIEGIKGGILEHVFLKISDGAVAEMHIDTDDANAHLINNNDSVEVIIPR